ncbi:hypothetical protein B0I37DRAFT_365177 [Chaetomium sp. MPI-CAGE-AT-0009]|nr:hypothetical protein B0I37DRAFT_365177 [Chaetomium sp. MPI-CAGE-AT-0009]
MICRSGRCGDGPATLVTSTRRVPFPPRPTTTRRATPTRSTARPQPTTIGEAPESSCSDNPLACIGISCKTDADCGGSLIICKNGICGL